MPPPEEKQAQESSSVVEIKEKYWVKTNKKEYIEMRAV